MSNIEVLITDMKESLEREIRQGFHEVTARFDVQEARLERHAALLQTGSRWTNRMNAWAEKMDALMAAREREIAALRERLDRLEREKTA